eukprot:11036574-Heterocapsa_arctica.AAC.1
MRLCASSSKTARSGFWVCLPGMSTGSGKRKDRKRLQAIVNLVRLRGPSGGDVVIDGARRN